MTDEKQQNALITGTSLTIADHGVLCGWITLDLECGSQEFGGHVLYSPSERNDTLNKQGNYAGMWIYRVLQIAGVEQWEQLKGKTIRTRGTWSGITSIGHIIKDDWFTPEEEFKRLQDA